MTELLLGYRCCVWWRSGCYEERRGMAMDVMQLRDAVAGVVVVPRRTVYGVREFALSFAGSMRA